MADARISVSLREGVIEIEGSESFVVAQLARFEGLIANALQSGARKQPVVGTGSGRNGGRVDEEAMVGAIRDYPNLFAVADGKVQITKDVPGANKAQKMVNVATLLTYANTLLGSDTTSYDAVRELCSNHGCLDATNFAKTMRGEKETFIVAGSGQAKTLKLSVPGKKKAEALAKQLS